MSTLLAFGCKSSCDFRSKPCKIGMSIFVDRGFGDHDEDKTCALISRRCRGLMPKLVADLRRRSAIDAEIGQMKTDGRLSLCQLKGTIGDALYAVLCACGHNIRKTLAYLWALRAWIIATLWGAQDRKTASNKPPLWVVPLFKLSDVHPRQRSSHQRLQLRRDLSASLPTMV